MSAFSHKLDVQKFTMNKTFVFCVISSRILRDSSQKITSHHSGELHYSHSISSTGVLPGFVFPVPTGLVPGLNTRQADP